SSATLSSSTPWRSPRRRATTPSCASERVRAPPCSSCGEPRRRRRSTGATSCCPTTSTRSPCPCSATGSCRSRGRPAGANGSATRPSQTSSGASSRRPLFRWVPSGRRRSGPERAARDGRLNRMSSESRGHTTSSVVRPTGRGLAIGIAGVVVLIPAYLFHRTELMFLGWFGVLLLAAALALVAVRRLRIDVTRTFSHSMLVAGHASVCELELRNLSPYATAEAHWQEVLPWHPVLTPPERLAPIPGRITSRTMPVRILRYEIVPPRRGRFQIGPLLIEVT